jgi:exosortase family protein XrtF
MKDFYPIFIKLLRFFVIYFGLMLIYDTYLAQYKYLAIDPLSHFQAQGGQKILQYFGFECLLVPDLNRHALWFYVNHIFTGRMVEGCNAISIAILFVAFCYVFYLGFWKNLRFISLGLLFLLLVNVLRIAALNALAALGSGQFKNFHDYIFPSIMYGSIVLLWLVWIKVFVLKAQAKTN